jgi:hypothetical protein
MNSASPAYQWVSRAKGRQTHWTRPLFRYLTQSVHSRATSTKDSLAFNPIWDLRSIKCLSTVQTQQRSRLNERMDAKADTGSRKVFRYGTYFTMLYNFGFSTWLMTLLPTLRHHLLWTYSQVSWENTLFCKFRGQDLMAEVYVLWAILGCSSIVKR